jgi:DNA processing protein
MDDASPPPSPKEIYDPPLITRVRGNPEVLTKPGIAMVGTRHPTPTVLSWSSGWHAIWPPKDWSLLLLVMSGLARGVDTASHRGAISAKGKTVAVLGTGVDVIYPPENSPLSEQILALGSALISEVPRGTFAPAQNFPIVMPDHPRNVGGRTGRRSRGISATRITAACALEQNRDVFQVPGYVSNKNSWGPNTLIQQGGVLVATWEDVGEELPTEL